MDAEDLALVFCRKEGTEDRQWFVLLPSIGKASYSTSYLLGAEDYFFKVYIILSSLLVDRCSPELSLFGAVSIWSFNSAEKEFVWDGVKLGFQRVH